MRKLIRLTESDLHRMVMRSVNKILNESGPYDNGVTVADYKRRKEFMSRLQSDELAKMIYDDKESVINLARETVDDRIVDKVIKKINNLHDEYHRRFPDGFVPRSERPPVCYQYPKRRLIRKINQGIYDEMIYNNREKLKNIARQNIDERLWDVVFRIIDERYARLCRQYPDGMPMLSDEVKEERKKAMRMLRDIERDRYNYYIFVDGEKFVDKMRRRFPNFPQVAQEAEKQLNWVRETFDNEDEIPSYF